MALEGQALLHRQQDLADAEQADHGHQEVDATEQLGPAEHHAQLAGHGVHADAGEQQAQRHRDDNLVPCLPAQPHERTEGQQIDREEFRRSEAQRKIRDARRQEGDQQHREEGSDERGCERRRQRLGRLALLRHWIAVERGCDRPGLAWDVEQDRGDSAAEQRAPIDAGQHHDGGGRVHREGQRQQDRDPVGPAQARQHADENAKHQPDHHQQQFVRRQEDLKPWNSSSKASIGAPPQYRRPLRAALSA